MTKNATSDLEEQIAELSAKLENPQSAHPSPYSLEIQSGNEPYVLKQTQDKKSSLEQCIVVCHRLLDHIEEVKVSVSESDAIKTMSENSIARDTELLAPRLTADALRMCTHSLTATAHHLRDLRAGNKSANGSDETRIAQQLDRAQECLDIVEKAQQYRVNTFEKINIAEDSFSTAVSTIGDLIKARGLTIGARSVNIMGQMNDESLQMMTYTLRPVASRNPPPTKTPTKFEERHGFGQTMSGGKQ
jgi:hypothetical protein